LGGKEESAAGRWGSVALSATVGCITAGVCKTVAAHNFLAEWGVSFLGEQPSFVDLGGKASKTGQNRVDPDLRRECWPGAPEPLLWCQPKTIAPHCTFGEVEGASIAGKLIFGSGFLVWGNFQCHVSSVCSFLTSILFLLRCVRLRVLEAHVCEVRTEIRITAV
jgi:hypothetical protein